jgi:hypothetical protein
MRNPTCSEEQAGELSKFRNVVPPVESPRTEHSGAGKGSETPIMSLELVCCLPVSLLSVPSGESAASDISTGHVREAM